MLYKKFNRFELFIAFSIALFIFLFYFLFNLNYLTNWIDEKLDANTYKNYVYRYIKDKDNEENKFIARYNLFNPHHIAFDWIGQLFFKTLNKNNFSVSLMQVLQIRNLFFSSLGLSVLFFLFYRFSKKILLSFLFIFIIGFTCGYWIYSQINDTAIIHSIMIANLFMITIYFPYVKNKYLYSLFLGVLHSINIFFHQSDFLFIFIILFIILFSKRQEQNEKNEDNKDTNNLKIISDNTTFNNILSFNKKNFSYFFIYLITLIIIISGAYYYVGLIHIGLTLDPLKATTINKIQDSNYFFNWIVLYSRIEYWGKGFEKNTFNLAIKGISSYFYQQENINFIHKLNLLKLFDIKSILPNMIFLLFLTIFLSVIIFFKKLVYQYKHIFISNIIFIALYFSFACWWEPDYREFWVAPMFSFWILAFLIFNYLLQKRNSMNLFSNFFIYSYLFLIMFLLFYFNFIFFLYPNSSTNFKVFDIINNINSFNY